MKFRRIELEGFQSYYDHQNIDLAGLNLVAIIGPNGAGKTTLFDAIEFALFGRYRGDVVRTVLSRGASKAEVALELDLGDATYRVVRSRTHSDRHEVVVSVADAEATTGWRELTEKNPAVADTYIVKLIGMNSTTARATWLIGQNDFGSFCQLQPAPRRAMLASAFGLDAFADLAAKAEESRDAARTRQEKAQVTVDNLKGRLNQLESDGPLADKTDAELKELIDKAEAEAERCADELAKISDTGADSRLEQARDALNSYQDGITRQQTAHDQQVTRAQKAVETATTQLQQAQASYDAAAEAVWEVDPASQEHKLASEAVEHAQAAVSNAQDSVVEAERHRASLEAERTAIEAQGREAGERIKPLEISVTKGSGVCFTCGQGLSADHAAQLLHTEREHRQSLLDTYQTKGTALERADTGIAEAKNDVALKQRTLAEAQRNERAAERKAQQVKDLAETEPSTLAGLERAQTAVQEARTEQGQVGPRPVTDSDKVEALTAAVTEAEKAVAATTAATDRRKELQAARNSARESERAVWTEQEHRTMAARHREELTEPLEIAEAEVETASRDAEHYDVLRQAFRPSGIPAMILAGVVEELNDDANDILSTLGGDLGVNVTTQKEKQGGGVDEKVMVYATTATGQVDYSTLSGAEKFRVALAVRCAMARCMMRRTGIPVETILLDEGWGALDENTRQAVQEMLTRLSSEFAIFTVSHIDDVKDSFSTVIDVRNDEGASRATVINR